MLECSAQVRTPGQRGDHAGAGWGRILLQEEAEWGMGGEGFLFLRAIQEGPEITFNTSVVLYKCLRKLQYSLW